MPPAGGGGTGFLLVTRDDTLTAQPVDADDLQALGQPVPLATGVFSIMGGTIGAAYVSASDHGTLVYRTGSITDLARQLVWYSRDGTPLGPVGERARYGQMKISPDGGRLAASRRG